MDGSSRSLVVNGFTDLDYFVLDRQLARMYWEYKEKYGLYVYDLLEGHEPRVVPVYSSPKLWPSKILLYVSGDIFIWLIRSEDVYEVIRSGATKEIANFNVLYKRGTDENHVRILQREVSSIEDHGRSWNPCLTKNCSHVCALTAPEGASCLCGQNEDLFLDQITCTGIKGFFVLFKIIIRSQS